MPRYHFVVREPDFTHDDPDGEDLPDDDAARDEGYRIVRELKESGYDVVDAVLIVQDESGRIVHSIPF
jgi:uncharacterized protein DUF6894